jgi:uncharacterized membrane protein
MTGGSAAERDGPDEGRSEPSPATGTATVPGMLERYPLEVMVSAMVVFTISIIIVLFFIFPETVWDHFLYRYLWGPVEADAGIEPTVPGEEPEASYNPVSTVLYGLMLAGGVYLVYRILGRYDIEVDFWFVLAVLPYIVLGSVARVLEDALLFEEPYVFFFISPFIYIILGLVTTAIALYSYLVPGSMQKKALAGIRARLEVLRRDVKEEEMKKEAGKKTGNGKTPGVTGIWKRELLPGMTRNERDLLVKWVGAEIFPYLLFTAIYMVLFYLARDDFAFLYSPHVIGATAIFFCATHIRLAAHPPRGLKGENRFFLYGMFLLVSFLLFYGRLLTGNEWEEIEGGVEIHLEVIPLILGLALLWTVLTWGLYRNVVPILLEGRDAGRADGKEVDAKRERDIAGGAVQGEKGRDTAAGASPGTAISSAMTTRMAVLLFAVHYVDAAATYVGLDFYDYREKHVLPDFLIELTGTAAVMFMLKLVVLSIIIYTMEIYYRREMLANPRMAGLMRIAVLVLGLAPGTRDMLRNAAGI